MWAEMGVKAELQPLSSRPCADHHLPPTRRGWRVLNSLPLLADSAGHTASLLTPAPSWPQPRVPPSWEPLGSTCRAWQGIPCVCQKMGWGDPDSTCASKLSDLGDGGQGLACTFRASSPRVQSWWQRAKSSKQATFSLRTEEPDLLTLVKVAPVCLGTEARGWAQPRELQTQSISRAGGGPRVTSHLHVLRAMPACPWPLPQKHSPLPPLPPGWGTRQGPPGQQRGPRPGRTWGW